MTKIKPTSQNVAIVSDQLAGSFGGAESIVLAAMDLFPEAPVFTTMHRKGFLPEPYESRNIRTTFLQTMPMAIKHYKAYLPLMPMAVELLNLQAYDVIFSSHHSMAKGIIPRPDAWHVCYCHSPARYLWDLYWTYADLNGFGPLKKILLGGLANYLRTWDVTAAARTDVFLANSTFTAKRVKKFYRREAHVLHPPVNVNKFSYEGTDDYYVMAGRLVAYKGFELAVDVFNELGKPLIIMGGGPEYERLKAKAKPNVKLLGRVDDATLKHHMGRCKGFVFPGKEDFGIVMGEAQAAGKPIVALGEGGALDIVTPGETGILAPEYTTEAFKTAIQEAEAIDWQPNLIAEQAKRFSEDRFKDKLYAILNNPEIYIADLK